MLHTGSSIIIILVLSMVVQLEDIAIGVLSMVVQLEDIAIGVL